MLKRADAVLCVWTLQMGSRIEFKACFKGQLFVPLKLTCLKSPFILGHSFSMAGWGVLFISVTVKRKKQEF